MRGRLLVAGQLLLLVALAATPWLTTEWSGPRWVSAAGLLLLGAGLVLGVVALRGLGSALTPLPEPRSDAELVTTGLYRWVRHPIYTALLTASAGWAALVPSAYMLTLWLALVVLLTGKARYEETLLRDRYPGYADYAARTPRFVPLPGPRRPAG